MLMYQVEVVMFVRADSAEAAMAQATEELTEFQLYPERSDVLSAQLLWPLGKEPTWDE